MSRKVKYGICGNFGGESVACGGQTVKTRIVAEALERICSSGNVMTLDTTGGARSLPKVFFGSFRLFRNCENIVIVTARSGVKMIIPLFLFLNRFYHRRIDYLLIGGWLPELLKEKPGLLKKLKKLNLVCPETTSAERKLRALGLENIMLLPNCRFSPKTEPEGEKKEFKEPLPLLYFSRITEGKGIKEALEAVKLANDRLGRKAFYLDVYGHIDECDRAYFDPLIKEHSGHAEYRGVTGYGDAPGIMKKYFAMLFLTRYRTEGLPGIIPEACGAGLPVIATEWDSARDEIEDGKNGMTVPMEGSAEAAAAILCDAAGNIEKWIDMRKECLKAFAKYDAELVMAEFDRLHG